MANKYLNKYDFEKQNVLFSNQTLLTLLIIKVDTVFVTEMLVNMFSFNMNKSSMRWHIDDKTKDSKHVRKHVFKSGKFTQSNKSYQNYCLQWLSSFN